MQWFLKSQQRLIYQLIDWLHADEDSTLEYLIYIIKSYLPANVEELDLFKSGS